MNRQRTPGRAWLGKTQHKLTVEDAATVRSIPVTPMLIEGIIPRGAIVLVTGETHVGKTFFALETMKAVSCRTPWGGVLKVSETAIGNSWLIEQDAPRADTGQAFWAMLKKLAHENPPDEWGYSPLSPLYFSWHPGLNLLNGESSAMIVEAALKFDTMIDMLDTVSHTPVFTEDGSFDHWEEDIEVGNSHLGVNLIVFDSLRAMHTGDENESGDMEAIMQEFKWIREKTGATIMILHHENSRGERPRGSTAIEAAADMIFRLKKDKRGVVATPVKSRFIQAPKFSYRIRSSKDPVFGDVKEVQFIDFLDEPVEDAVLNEPSPVDQLLEFITKSGQVKGPACVLWGTMKEFSQSSIYRWLKQLKDDGKIKQDGELYEAVKSSVDNPPFTT